MATGSEITNFWVCPTSTVVVNCAILDTKQRRLFVGTDDGIIRSYNIFNGQILHELSRLSPSKSSNPKTDKAEVISLCFVYRQMRILLAATFSDTSSISFWPEYPPNYMMSAVFNLDIRGNFGLSTPEQIGFVLHENISSSSSCVPILMANGRLATISIDSGHMIAEFSIAPAVASPGLMETKVGNRDDHQALLTLDVEKTDQNLIRMFVLAHKKNFLIAVESANHFHCWDFARNMFKKSFDVPRHSSGQTSSISCMDLSSDDGVFCVADSLGWIHTYVNPFSIQSNSRTPNWSFCAQAESIIILKFVGNLDIIACSGSDLVTRLWRPDGKHFLHTEKSSASLKPDSFTSSAHSGSHSPPSNSLGALSCLPWKYEILLLAQGNFVRNPKSKMKDTIHLLSRIKSVKADIVSVDEEKKQRPQPIIKSLKLRPPTTPQEERDQARMLVALATPRRGPAVMTSSLPHLHSLRGPHSKIMIHPIAPDPYLTPIKACGSLVNHTMRRDPSRAFLPKDSFKESILRQEEQANLRTSEASPLLKRSLKPVSFE